MERFVVGMSGASGAILGIRLLEVLSKSDFEVHLVISGSAKRTIAMETDWKLFEENAGPVGAEMLDKVLGVMEKSR